MATADERRESRKKTGQANQAAGKYKSVTPSKAAVKNTTYNDPVRDRDNRTTTTTTVAAPAPKAKVTNYKAGNPNAVVNKGGLGVSQQNRPRIPGTNKPGVKSFGYGYYDQNKEWISPREDAQDGYGPGGSGAKFGGMHSVVYQTFLAQLGMVLEKKLLA
jgi:hypothetical protein